MRCSHLIGLALGACSTIRCSANPISLQPPLTPSPTPICTQASTRDSGIIAVPGDSPSFSYSIYLPPCYAIHTDASYTTLYWTAISGPDTFEVADQLITRGEVPPFLLVMLNIDLADGYGADERIVAYAVPYIDAHYRTVPQRQQRGITGISHGAAIAVRAAFRAPDVFGRVAVISGGIDELEQEQFALWLASTPAQERPAIWIDVGDQDGIISLTNNLIDVLDENGVPYTFTQGVGGHSVTYWGSHKAEYLKWLVPGL